MNTPDDITEADFLLLARMSKRMDEIMAANRPDAPYITDPVVYKDSGLPVDEDRLSESEKVMIARGKQFHEACTTKFMAEFTEEEQLRAAMLQQAFPDPEPDEPTTEDLIAQADGARQIANMLTVSGAKNLGELVERWKVEQAQHPEKTHFDINTGELAEPPTNDHHD